jgi:hypothetical protein
MAREFWNRRNVPVVVALSMLAVLGCRDTTKVRYMYANPTVEHAVVTAQGRVIESVIVVQLPDPCWSFLESGARVVGNVVTVEPVYRRAYAAICPAVVVSDTTTVRVEVTESGTYNVVFPHRTPAVPELNPVLVE